MATTTATLTLNSADITGDALALSTTATLTKDGSTVGLDQVTGVARKSFDTVTDSNLLAAADYTDDKAHKVYIKNTSTNTGETVKISLAGGATSTNYDLGVLSAGDWAFFPWEGTNDIDITTDADITVEYCVFYEA